jgi:hypothetical protein
VSSRIALAAPSDIRTRRERSATEVNWLKSAAIAAGIVAVFAIVYALEMGAGRWNSPLRVADSPSEGAARYVGISHFLLAFAFLATSRKMRAAAPWGGFSGKLAVGGALCVAYALMLPLNPRLAGVLFAAYFLVHDCRDQVLFYFANGDAPEGRDNPTLRRALTWPPFLALGAIVAAASAALLLSGRHRATPILRDLAPPLPAQIVVAMLLVVGLAAWRWRALVRQEEPLGIGEFLRKHRPVFFVWAGTLLVVLADLGLTGEVRLIVLLHVTCWYVFVHRQMRRNPPEKMPRAGSWAWMRTTANGFAVLHAGLALLLIGAGALWAYGFQGSPELSEFRVLLDRKSFPFWTILHVTVSLGR